MRWVLVAFGLLAPAGASSAVESLLRLPHDGGSVSFGVHDETVRVRLTGTVSSSLDGREYDAGEIVSVPAGASLASSDPVAHSYEVVVPAGSEAAFRLQIGDIASRHLVTWTEAGRSLSGAIRVERIGGKPPVRAAVSEASTHPTAWGGAAVTLPALLLAGLALRRRRRREDRWIERRARAAVRRVRRESAALGPPFDAVAREASSALEGVRGLRRDVVSAEAALGRTAFARAPAARAKRAEILRHRELVKDQMRRVTERLEETAAALAAHRTGRSRAPDADALLASLSESLETAVSADEEARAAGLDVR